MLFKDGRDPLIKLYFNNSSGAAENRSTGQPAPSYVASRLPNCNWDAKTLDNWNLGDLGFYGDNGNPIVTMEPWQSPYNTPRTTNGNELVKLRTPFGDWSLDPAKRDQFYFKDFFREVEITQKEPAELTVFLYYYPDENKQKRVVFFAQKFEPGISFSVVVPRILSTDYNKWGLFGIERNVALKEIPFGAAEKIEFEATQSGFIKKSIEVKGVPENAFCRFEFLNGGIVSLVQANTEEICLSSEIQFQTKVRFCALLYCSDSQSLT